MNLENLDRGGGLFQLGRQFARLTRFGNKAIANEIYGTSSEAESQILLPPESTFIRALGSTPAIPLTIAYSGAAEYIFPRQDTDG